MLRSIQKWLKKKYPKEKRAEIREIYLNEKHLEGELDLLEFMQLEEIYISHYLDENGVEIKNQQKGTKITKLVNAQAWLEENYPKNGVCIRETEDENDAWGDLNRGWNNKGKTRNQITKLGISIQSLEGSLDLSGFSNLINFDCSWNKLTDLNAENNQKLTDVVCWSNQLEDIRLNNNNEIATLNLSNNKLSSVNHLSLNPSTLTRLFLDDNDFPVQDLSVFGSLINLEDLLIGNLEFINELNEEKINQNIYNRFVGSLRPLARLNKLKRLGVSNTDINSGVEYLPVSLREIQCDIEARPSSKLQEIKWQLELFASKKQKNWEELEFTLVEIKSWVEIGIEGKEYEFAEYLKNQKKFTPRQAKSNLDKLRAEYWEYKDPTWKYIHSDFTPELQIEWKDKGFNGLQAEEWIKKGKLRPEDSELAKYLFVEKRIIPQKFSEKQVAKFRKEYIKQAKSTKIEYLETRVQELIDAIQKQRKKIIIALSPLLPEGELLQELIKVYLEFIEFKNLEVDSADYNERCNNYEDRCREINNQLRGKLDKKTMNKVRGILTDCEKLVERGLELKRTIENKSSLIEKNRQTLNLQGVSNKKVSEKEDSTLKLLKNSGQQLIGLILEDELKGIKGLPEYFLALPPDSEAHTSKNLTSMFVEQAKEKELSNAEKKEVLVIIKEILEVKRTFINRRQITIKDLQSCYNELKGSKKYAQASEVSEVTSIWGRAVSSLTLGISKILVDTAKAWNVSDKRKFFDEQAYKFEKLLANDEKSLFLLNNDLINKLNIEHKERLFAAKYKIFEIDHSIWKNKPFSTAEAMEKFIILLNKNLEILKEELEKEERRFKKLKVWFRSNQY